MVTLACRLLLFVVFATSAASKLRGGGALERFGTSIAVMGGLPAKASSAAAMLISALEATVLVLLVVPVASAWRAGFILSVALLLLFEWAIARTIFRKVSVACRCFGSDSKLVGPQDLVRNLPLLLVAAVGAITSSTSLVASWPSVLMTAACAAGAALLLVNFDNTLWIMSPSPYTDSMFHR
jgi:uncharacterized membrane protein YphA (DoxX/SURF4 family)